ncbi:MAG: sigma-54-dependent Fis family transcriptional regulator [Kiritimatiellae bacterium]|nr:sigma-54-dependent Fis family transcriptional regulator [Kiritimatiellia bacterium]
MKKQHKILIVDDEKNTRDGLRRALSREYDVFTAESAAAALRILEEEHIDLMLSDVRMPGEDGIELLKQVRSKYPNTTCVLLTAYGSVETAVEAMKQGAHDFLTKPVNLDHLDMLIARTLQHASLLKENEELKRQLDSRYGLESIIGSSPAMERLFDVIRQAAPSQATVLIQGGSGTGKELVAQAMHRLSNCASGPFVAVHCAALSPTLLESELFGHEKGAFTGAMAQRKGRFEMANGGTLFLDEISEIDLATQVKLLRVLETRQFERVGGAETLTVNIRVIAATNRDLRKYVDEGKFREDLYYRLNVIEINLPSLKERSSDIPILCDYFIREFAERNQRNVSGISQGAIAALQAYDWPGNVRELRNTIEKMVVLARGEILEAEDVPENIKNALLLKGVSLSSTALPQTTIVGEESLAEMEKRKILDALNAAGGNKSKAAEALGISRRTLHRKLNEWKLS